MEKEMSVKELVEFLKKVEDAGYGDFKIKFEDGYLYEDECGINYMTKEVTMRGHIYNCDVIKKVRDFKASVDKAYEKLYR